ncbi:hypothetical protein ACB496_15505 [Lelliottia nimipressuralis]|uniref:hypothetical protein n=1 Tax=Lelliottia nimipressuralis TaxID=69220 RepID=UPI003558AE52
MKKLFIAVGLMVVTGSCFATADWKDGDSSSVDVIFSAPDTITFTHQISNSFSVDNKFTKSTMLGAITAEKATNDGMGIRFKWATPSTAGKTKTAFKQEDGGATFDVELKDTEGHPLSVAEDGGDWLKVDGKANDSVVTVQIYPADDVKVTKPAGTYTADIQAAVYSN